MKTIKERLQELPDGYRELALKYENWRGVIKVENMADAINSFVDWKDTKEWSTFWHDVYMHYEKWTPLPPLPLTKNERQFHTYMSLPQLTMKLDNWETYPVASLVWLDGGKTLRAFPEKELEDGEPKSYVIYTQNEEESDVGATLVC